MYLGHLMRLDDGSKRSPGIRSNRRPLPESRELRWDVVIGDDIVFLAIPQIHRAEFRSADTGGILKHLLEYRLQLAGRGTDDLKNLRGRSLLFERFAQIIGTLP